MIFETMPRRLVIAVLSGFVGGIFLRSFVDFGWAFVLFFVFLGVFFCSFYFYKQAAFYILIGPVFISAGLGILRYDAAGLPEQYSFFEKSVGSKFALEGIVTDEPDERENYTRLIVEKDEVKTLIYAQNYPKFNYGDKIKVSGTLKRPESFSPDFNPAKNQNSSGVNWPAYLAKDDIYFEMFYPEIELISSGNGSFIKRKLFELKGNFLSAISRAVPEPHAAFLGGITVGARKSIPKQLQDDLIKTGVVHIVALSGYNVTIVADYIMQVFSFLPRFLGIGFGAVGIVLFAIMTGASATVMRASIMALLVLTARATGRIYTVSWALFLAAFFMILQNPKILRFDASFQLSFLATLGLIYLAPFFERKLKFMPKKFKIREIMSATVSAQVMVTPLLVYKTGMISLVSLPANMLILIFIPVTMFFGFATGFVGMASAALSVPFGWISYAFLQYEIWIIEFFAKVPNVFI